MPAQRAKVPRCCRRHAVTCMAASELPSISRAVCSSSRGSLSSCCCCSAAEMSCFTRRAVYCVLGGAACDAQQQHQTCLVRGQHSLARLGNSLCCCCCCCCHAHLAHCTVEHLQQRLLSCRTDGSCVCACQPLNDLCWRSGGPAGSVCAAAEHLDDLVLLLTALLGCCCHTMACSCHICSVQAGTCCSAVGGCIAPWDDCCS